MSWYLTSAGQQYVAEYGMETCPGCGYYECRCEELASREDQEPDCSVCDDEGVMDCPTCGGESWIDEDGEEPCPGCEDGSVPCAYCPG